MRLSSYGRQTIEEDDVRAVTEALRSDFLTTGPLVDRFEEEFSKYIGCRHSVAVNSGTAALEIAVAALELPKESEIIVTPFTFASDTNCILLNNLKPIFADIHPETLNLDPADVKKRITPRTKAIICVDFGGRPCDFGGLQEIAKQNNLYLIDDACHAVGGEYKGKRLGNLADMSCFSFHPVKTMTTGEGGMVTTNDGNWARKLRILRNHGMIKPPQLHRYGEDAFYEYDFVALSRNFRLTSIQCALGLSQLKKLDRFIEKRLELVAYYNELLKDLNGISLPLAKTSPNNRYSWHLYYILLDREINKNKLLNYMKSKGIGVHSFYIPTHKFTYHSSVLGHQFLPVAEDIFSRIVVLPMFPLMQKEDIEHVVDELKQAL